MVKSDPILDFFPRVAEELINFHKKEKLKKNFSNFFCLPETNLIKLLIHLDHIGHFQNFP